MYKLFIVEDDKGIAGAFTLFYMGIYRLTTNAYYSIPVNAKSAEL